MVVPESAEVSLQVLEVADHHRQQHLVVAVAVVEFLHRDLLDHLVLTEWMAETENKDHQVEMDRTDLKNHLHHHTLSGASIVLRRRPGSLEMRVRKVRQVEMVLQEKMQMVAIEVHQDHQVMLDRVVHPVPQARKDLQDRLELSLKNLDQMAYQVLKGHLAHLV